MTVREEKRGILLLNDNESTDAMTAPASNSHSCSEFAIHHELPFLCEMRTKNKALFVMSIGAMDKKVDKTNHKTSALKLFAHDHMQNNVQHLDPFASAPRAGILGRMASMLSESIGLSGNNYQVGSTSIETSSTALRVASSNAPSASIVGKNGVKKFDPHPWNVRSSWRDVDLLPTTKEINNSTSAGSSLYAKLWSSTFLKVLDGNKFLESVMPQAGMTQSFGGDGMSQKLLQVAKLIQVAGTRGADRDLFFAEFRAWDHHSSMKERIALKFKELNGALEAFWSEMKLQNNEDKVVAIATSDFGRTLTKNSNRGSKLNAMNSILHPFLQTSCVDVSIIFINREVIAS